MESRNRGVKKPKLRDLSQHALSNAESKALVLAIQPTAPPIVMAIIGAVYVEHELENCIRRRMPRKNEDSWLALIDERGPLDTFSRKIAMGYALRLYEAGFKKNLDIVRAIRNAFAHSKRLIDFDHPLVVKELTGIAIPPTRKKMFSQLKTTKYPHAEIYGALCLTLGLELMKVRLKAETAKLNRLTKKQMPSPLGRALGSQFSPTAYKAFLEANPGLNLPPSPLNQISDPTRKAQQGLLYGLLPIVLESKSNL
jgi:hypothetical protein